MNVDVKKLADTVEKLCDSLRKLGPIEARTAAQLLVMVSTITALVKTHPDPEAFAVAFRSSWFALGEKHADGDSNPHALAAIDELLSIIEGACQAPLKVRPPRTE